MISEWFNQTDMTIDVLEDYRQKSLLSSYYIVRSFISLDTRLALQQLGSEGNASCR
jgi:hypothetical protein